MVHSCPWIKHKQRTAFVPQSGKDPVIQLGHSHECHPRVGSYLTDVRWSEPYSRQLTREMQEVLEKQE